MWNSWLFLVGTMRAQGRITRGSFPLQMGHALLFLLALLLLPVCSSLLLWVATWKWLGLFAQQWDPFSALQTDCRRALISGEWGANPFYPAFGLHCLGPTLAGWLDAPWGAGADTAYMDHLPKLSPPGPSSQGRRGTQVSLQQVP